jgi:hypothetical protein
MKRIIGLGLVAALVGGGTALGLFLTGGGPALAATTAAQLCTQYALPGAQADSYPGTPATLSDAYMVDVGTVRRWDQAQLGGSASAAEATDAPYNGLDPSTPLAVCYFSGHFAFPEAPWDHVQFKNDILTVQMNGKVTFDSGNPSPPAPPN